MSIIGICMGISVIGGLAVKRADTTGLSLS
jgi:hypothetical protein